MSAKKEAQQRYPSEYRHHPAQRDAFVAGAAWALREAAEDGETPWVVRVRLRRLANEIEATP